MPQHASAKRRMRISERRRAYNRSYKSRLRTMLKKVRSTEDPDKAEELYRATVSLLDRLVIKGVVKKNTAANRKSTLARHVNKLRQGS